LLHRQLCVHFAGTYEQLLMEGVDLAAFVPLNTSQQQHTTDADSASEAGGSNDDDINQLLQQRVSSPKAAISPTAAVGAAGISSPTAAASKSGGGLLPLKSFSGNVIELPPMHNQTAAGGSFASHKPFKQGQQQHGVAAAAAAAVAAADAEHGGSGPGSVVGCGFGSAASFAMYGTAGSSSKHTLDTIPDPDEEDTEQQQQQQGEVVAAAAVGQKVLHIAANGNGLLAESANSTDDDDVAEVAALVVTSPRKAQQQQQQQQGLGDVSVHSDQQSKSGAESAAGAEKEGSRSGKLIRAEERARGQVRKSVYMAYLLAMGPLLLLPIGVTIGECASGVVYDALAGW
jgi:hypothetical protein